MNGAFRTTALMGILAAAMIAGALYYYPKTAEIVVDAKVNQNLFETYETNDVRSISITQFSNDSNRIEQFRLRRKGERWVIPNVGDFPATRIARIGEVAKSLLDRKVLSLATEDEQGHVEYGVIDPTESANSPNRSSLGMRIDLLDRNKGDIANLIIGKAVPGSNDGVPRYYVRVPGQPAVYELEVPKQIFKTRFQDWVDPNLLELPPPGSTEVAISKVNVDQYRLDPETIASADRKSMYRCEFEIEQMNVKKLLFELSKDGEFEEQKLTPPQQQEVASTLMSIVRLLLGSLAQGADSDSLDLHFHAMLIAQLEDSTFEEPEKPEGVEEDSSENKAYLRALEELDRKRKSATMRIDELNRNWSKWIYVIPETTVNAIRPDISL